MCDIQTNKMSKVCSKCSETKPVEEFISKDRCICKPCMNAYSREKRKNRVIDPTIMKLCIHCDTEKSLAVFIYRTGKCKDCNNIARREKFQESEELREKIRADGRDYKRRKTEARQKARAEEQAKLKAEIGESNTICKYCKKVVDKTRFRHNRLKCKDCERDDPDEKFRRTIRSRIWGCLERKTKHTIEYLGCSYDEYDNWIANYSDEFTMENRGTVWHIDHVIPLARFDLDDPEQQLIAFNWRNTAPLLARENLAKNKKIIPTQIEQHLTKLAEYHTKYNIEFPSVFAELFCNTTKLRETTLEPSLPLHSGNSVEELG